MQQQKGRPESTGSMSAMTWPITGPTERCRCGRSRLGQGVKQKLDGMAWKIQRRIIAAMDIHHEHLSEVARVKKPRAIRQSSLDCRLESLGHRLYAEGQHQGCNLCGMNWHKRQREDIITMGPCMGPFTYVSIPEQIRAPVVVPAQVTLGSSLVHCGRHIHASSRRKAAP